MYIAVTMDGDTDGPDNNNACSAATDRRGTVTWRKTDSDTGDPLAGSQWTLSGGALASGVTITDCVADSASQCTSDSPYSEYYDSDPQPGSFRVTGLTPSDSLYSLREAQAPAGYVLSTRRNWFYITTDQLTQNYTSAFKNSKVGVPAIPLTGGIGSALFLGGGGALTALSLVLAVRRTRRRTRH